MDTQKTMPLWLDVSKKIQSDIEKGKLKAGDKLPGEFELCKIYCVSRITVRSALSRLEESGLIKRIKGKGTVVSYEKINEPLLKIQGFSEEMKLKGIIPGTSFARMQKKSVSGYIAELFALPKSAKINVLERVRTINGVKVGYFTTYFGKKIDLPCDDSLYYGSLYEKLSENYGIKIDRVVQKISADVADQTVRKALDIDGQKPVLVMRRWAYENDELIEYSVCRYNGEKYEYGMELKS